MVNAVTVDVAAMMMILTVFYIAYKTYLCPLSACSVVSDGDWLVLVFSVCAYVGFLWIHTRQGNSYEENNDCNNDTNKVNEKNDMCMQPHFLNINGCGRCDVCCQNDLTTKKKKLEALNNLGKSIPQAVVYWLIDMPGFVDAMSYYNDEYFLEIPFKTHYIKVKGIDQKIDVAEWIDAIRDELREFIGPHIQQLKGVTVADMGTEDNHTGVELQFSWS